MATVLHRVPVERITAEARDMHPATTILTTIAAFLWAVGYVAGKVLGALWFALMWTFAAVKVGWADARRPAPPAPEPGVVVPDVARTIMTRESAAGGG